MERWQNRVAVVTGASSGIGAACMKYLANNGMVVVGLARRKELMDALRDQVEPEARARVHAIRCDLRDDQQIIAAFKEIESKYGPVAVLVNNAGTVRVMNLVNENNSQDVNDVINTNVLGVVNCTREAFRSMKANGGDGHVFMINSISGHIVPRIPNHSLNIYAPTKFAVTAMTEVYRQEFLNQNTKVKVTSISPGAVDTEIVPQEMKVALENPPFLQPEDIADALLYSLQTPPHVQIHEMIVKPIGELL
ncbi:farnesol dehydrogenase-like [Anastrepha ludens]|uniref:farnesol dehydrogenase-like n=1 Tax=Anastrepha ludens TaxID=28586 RepID=UPI0023B15941|nr:farnesol dehydrogenase-like [Anastrepha ludens]